VELDERDYAKQRLSLDELRALFEGADPRDYVNPKSPTFKAMGLRGKTLTPESALKLMAEEPNLLKRPLTIVGRKMVAGFDRDRLREVLK
jgi:arsenate reductase-like glutaredoxin family protein